METADLLRRFMPAASKRKAPRKAQRLKKAIFSGVSKVFITKEHYHGQKPFQLIFAPLIMEIIAQKPLAALLFLAYIVMDP